MTEPRLITWYREVNGGRPQERELVDAWDALARKAESMVVVSCDRIDCEASVDAEDAFPHSSTAQTIDVLLPDGWGLDLAGSSWVMHCPDHRVEATRAEPPMSGLRADENYSVSGKTLSAYEDSISALEARLREVEAYADRFERLFNAEVIERERAKARVAELEEALRKAAEWFETWPSSQWSAVQLSDAEMGRLCRAALNPYPKETL